MTYRILHLAIFSISVLVSLVIKSYLLIIDIVLRVRTKLSRVGGGDERG